SKEVRKKIGEYTKKITRKEYLDSLIEERITEEVVRDKYIELVNELTGKKEIRIRHILTKTRNESQSVLNKVKAGQSFEKLAKNYSLDKMTSDQGGDLGYVLDSSLNQEFVDVVAAMKVGSVSNPIKTKYGWHIIKIEDIKDTEIMPFEDIKKSIEEELRQQEIKNIFSEIMDEAEVEVLINAKNSPTEVREEVKEEAKEVEGK
ncbi:MAG: peptidylprolyl isomerase, partial [Proteobacteria bacterium]|nr:peptidylprolyl isomerase [Pseudomonadota bacterium]